VAPVVNTCGASAPNLNPVAAIFFGKVFAAGATAEDNAAGKENPVPTLVVVVFSWSKNDAFFFDTGPPFFSSSSFLFPTAPGPEVTAGVNSSLPLIDSDNVVTVGAAKVKLLVPAATTVGIFVAEAKPVKGLSEAEPCPVPMASALSNPPITAAVPVGEMRG